jgi:ribosomal protein S18 acetylase RimI-like enzyme
VSPDVRVTVVAGLGLDGVVALLDRSLELEYREAARASRAAIFRELPDVAWTLGGTPGMGPTVYRTHLAEADADARISELSAALELFGPVTWWAGPSAEPDNLADRLLAAGYHLDDDEAGMAADLAALVEDLPRPEALRITPVEQDDETLDDGRLDAWLEVNRRTWPWTEAKVEHRRDLYRSDDRRPRPWRHVVGWLDEQPVAAARVFVEDEVAMVHGIATIPEARRQGIGAAITAAALVDARARGCRVGVLQASSMGQGPYRRIGFRFVAPYARFVREPGGSEPLESAGGQEPQEAHDQRGNDAAA